jgi:hypothetical protein
VAALTADGITRLKYLIAVVGCWENTDSQRVFVRDRLTPDVIY